MRYAHLRDTPGVIRTAIEWISSAKQGRVRDLMGGQLTEYLEYSGDVVHDVLDGHPIFAPKHPFDTSGGFRRNNFVHLGDDDWNPLNNTWPVPLEIGRLNGLDQHGPIGDGTKIGRQSDGSYDFSPGGAIDVRQVIVWWAPWADIDPYLERRPELVDENGRQWYPVWVLQGPLYEPSELRFRQEIVKVFGRWVFRITGYDPYDGWVLSERPLPWIE
jgi:hypothetical protein